MTEEVRKRITDEIKPKLSNEPDNTEARKKETKSLGLRASIVSQQPDGASLSFSNINPGSRDIFSKTIPDLLVAMGTDLNVEFSY